MSDTSRVPRSRTPWIVAALAGVVTIVLLVVYFVPLAHAKDDQSVGDFTTSEKAAMTAAGTEAANLLSYRRAFYDSDYARAVAGTTGDLKKDVVAKKSQVLSTLNSGKFDLSARVTHEALVGPLDKVKAGTGYLVLVTVNGYKSTTPQVPTQQNLQLTMQKSGSSWLVSAVQNVALS